MFYDEVKVHMQAGGGGDGAVAFRREKFVPFGGPSGGDGGKGGDVVLVVNPHFNTLYHLRHQVEFVASDGEKGRNKQQYGAGGEDLLLKVPPGTLVTDVESGAVLADLKETGRQFIVAHGGKGGRGNMRFATATNQAPRIAERGDPGEDLWVKLELKLLADVGLVGKPNAGKSTLLSVTTSARPRIAPYPFTTLQPNLGVVALGENETFVMADMPGLIEGASLGKGLGHEFLRHIERTRVLLHLLDGTAPDPVDDFRVINQELADFGHGLSDKPQLAVINKLDMPEARERFPQLRAEIEALGYAVLGISALTHEGTRQLLGRAYQILEETPVLELAVPVIIQAPLLEEEGFTIEQAAGDVWKVHGGKIERAVRRTNFNFRESVLRLHRYLKSQGVIAALHQAGVQEGDMVHIGDYELEWREQE